MPDPVLGLALIARDEQATLPTLLASIEGAFDEVVLLDTGSTDKTIETFKQWAARETERNPAFRHTVGEYGWQDDFAAARTAADTLLSDRVDWTCWADCDDELHGATNLRQIAANAPPEVVALIASYAYAFDPHGNCVCVLKRERLVRRGHGSWAGKVHEAQLLEGGSTQLIPRELCEWRHRKPHTDTPVSSDRNLRILHAWNDREPDDPRVLGYLGTEEMVRGRLPEAEGYLRRYLQLKTGWDEERAQIHRKLATILLATERVEEAIGVAFEALRLLPAWPDSHLTLAEAHYRLGEFAKAGHWAREVLRIGPPDTLLIINPLDYDHLARVILAGALGGQGRIDDAIRVADEAMAIAPHPGLEQGYRQWRSLRKREQTADAFLAAAETLVAHDEQAKALSVLEAVPYYAQDHPRVVALRSQVRERILPLYDTDSYIDHYQHGGSKPEDAVEDHLAVGDALPRCGFLLNQVRELAGVGAGA